MFQRFSHCIIFSAEHLFKIMGEIFLSSRWNSGSGTKGF